MKVYPENQLRLKIFLDSRKKSITSNVSSPSALVLERANTITSPIERDYLFSSAAGLAGYSSSVASGPIRDELYPVRNVHQSFGHGLMAGLVYSGLSLLTGGWWVRDPMPTEAGHERMQRVGEKPGQGAGVPVTVDRTLTFDKLTNVHYSGTRHEEDQPSHLLVHDTDICRTTCLAEYQNPCTRFCPANVYEMVGAEDGTDGVRLQISASNCVHCKTCDIMDPYQIIEWVVPEGGGGPKYIDM